MSNSLTLTEETYALTVVEGDDLQLTLSGEQGPAGPVGPNLLSTSTTTALNGYIYGNGTNVAGATAAATASNPNTLVLRDALGASEFGGLSTNGQVEFNGVDAGDSLTFNMVNYFYGTGAAAAHRTALGVGTTDSPTFAGATFATGTITTSQPLTLTQTWNNAATTFKAIDLNVTDTNSNAASLLMDLRVGGVSRLSLRPVGNELLTVSATNTSSSYLQTLLRCVSGDGGVTQFAVMGSGNPRGVFVGANCGYGFANISTSSASVDNVDLYVFRDAANTLAQRNGTNAQESRIYGTYTSSTNYERLSLKYNATDTAFQIGTEKGSGGGSARPLQLRTDSTTRATISATGNVGIGTTSPSERLHLNGDGGFLKFSGTVNNSGTHGVTFAHSITPSANAASGIFGVPTGAGALGRIVLAASGNTATPINTTTDAIFTVTSSGATANKGLTVSSTATNDVFLTVGPGAANNAGDKGILFDMGGGAKSAGIIAKASGSLGDTSWVGLAIDNAAQPTSASVGLMLNSSGNVGIGTTSPSQRLDVVGSIKASQPIIFPSYTVGTLPTGASYTGGMAYVTDEAGGPTMAFYDGTNWRRVQDRAVVSVAP